MSSAPLSVDRRSLLTRGAVGAVGALGALSAQQALFGAPAQAATGLTFTTVSPYRAYDSRTDSQNPVAQSGRAYRVEVTTNIAGNNMISGAKAIAYTLTIADVKTGSGFLAIMPGSETAVPTFSTINWWQMGTVLANSGIVGLGTTAETATSVTVYCGGGGSTAYLLDVTGYYS